MAWADTERSGHMTRFIGASVFVADAASTTTKAGWVLGAGAERWLGGHVMLRLEYLWYRIDNNNVTLMAPIVPGPFLPVSFVWSRDDVQVVRAGLGYKF